MPLLSIVIPVKDRQELIDFLLNKLISLTLELKLSDNIEIIVVDDFSKKELVVPLSELKIILIRNQENLGASISRKIGFYRSRGKYVHFHDSDDMVSICWLTKLVYELKTSSYLDMLLTGRIDRCENNDRYCFQKFFHGRINEVEKIQSRLVYRNCMGPLGGVTFSRQVLEKIEFKNFASCQDWQMYIDAIKHSKVLVSRPDIKFIFNKTGDDRISHNPRKKILGHRQLSKITSKESIFKRNIRLFYLYTCKQHIYNKGGSILKFYKKNRIKIFATFIVISLYWRLT